VHPGLWVWVASSACHKSLASERLLVFMGRGRRCTVGEEGTVRGVTGGGGGGAEADAAGGESLSTGWTNVRPQG
jgi:hypothetical protein